MMHAEHVVHAAACVDEEEAGAWRTKHLLLLHLTSSSGTQGVQVENACLTAALPVALLTMRISLGMTALPRSTCMQHHACVHLGIRHS